MDLSGKDKFGIEEMNEDHLSYHTSTLSSEWQFNHQPIDPSSVSPSPCPSLPMLDSFLSSLQGWKNPGILPASFSHFPTNSGFMESVSCYNGGNFSSMVNNPFPTNEPLSPYQREKDDKGSNNELGEAEFSGDGQDQEATNSSCKGSGVKKRRRVNQDLELDQVQGENLDTKKKEEQNRSTKPSGMNVKDGSDGTKEDYIHVRARRGQATNNHSLAERVRREKISERMKFLQDIVPGCSKVIGKAVMLDEIINYVQSLQKQVEFLSMKLATVNPRLDLNVEGLLSKDLLQLRGGSSSSIGFSPDMIHPMLHPFHKGLVQAEIPSTVSSSDAVRRAINDHLISVNGYRELTSQMANVWEDELHNVLQMNLGPNTPLNVEEANGKSRESFPL